jgi:hypothetical protein
MTLQDFCTGQCPNFLTEGDPHLDFEKAMEVEHCSKGDSKVRFVTENYHINTFPANEWAITVLHDMTGADLQHERKLVTIEENMKKEIVAIARLIRCEVIAVVLYTGPMVGRTHGFAAQIPSGVILRIQ